MLNEQLFNAPGVAINYAQGPDAGPPLVLLHGVMRCWQDYLTLIPGFVSRWTVFAADARGHGKSGRAGGFYRVADYVPDAVAFVKSLAERLGQPVALYGHSMGAMVAAAAAAEAPAAVRAAVLEDPPYDTMGRRVREGPWHAIFTGMQAAAGRGGPVREIATAMGDIRVPGAGPGGTPGPLRNVRDAASLRFGAWCLSRLDPAVVAPLVAGQWLAGHEARGVFPRVKCPVLLLQADPAAGGAMTDEDAGLAESLMADCTRVRVSGVGHLIHGTDAGKVLQLAHGFLESVR